MQPLTGFQTIPLQFRFAGIVFILAIPFIQIGLSVYISVSFGAAVIALMVGGVSVVRNQSLLTPSMPFFLGCGIKIASALLSSIDYLELLVLFREIACYFVFLSVISIVDEFSGQWERTKTYLTLLFAVICIFSFVQASFLARGQFIGLPTHYFVINRDTLEGSEELILNGYRFRATGFYGEPSYLSFVVMTLMTVILYAYPKSSFVLNGILGFVAITVSIVTESFSGALAITLWLFAWVISTWRRFSRIARWVFLKIFFAAIIGLFLYFGGAIGDRALLIIGGNDESFAIRLESPLHVVWSMNWNELLTGRIGMRDVQIDNGILSLFIRYGFISFLLIGSMLLVAKDLLAILYLVIAFNFSGSVLAYDKVILLGLAVGAMGRIQKNGPPIGRS